MASILQRLAASVCLAVVLVTGLTPSNGFVICLEPDGCVTIEVQVPTRECGGCDGHEEVERNTMDEVCPCLDLPIPGTSEDRRLERKAFEHRSATFAAAWPAAAAEIPSASPVDLLPRPPESLARIRSVVLLV